ncbi:hypothetical protein [Tenacibaculum sp. 190524A05c]|uniref:hypothetical protein n=1 Tax=Tenacibaculum platacis TaxID=3137852 RepID=UPI0032B309C7
MKKKWFSCLLALGLLISCSEDNSSGVVSGGDGQTGGNGSTDKIFYGNVLIQTQNELESFAENNYTKIYGELWIEGEEINDISNLSSLKEIQGDLRIRNTSIVNLDGLANLELNNISENLLLSIRYNDKLESIGALKKVEKVTDFLLSNNNNLLNINGLGNFKELRGLFIDANPKLESVEGLYGLEVCNELTFQDNPKLITLDGLEKLKYVNFASVRITGNTALRDFCSLTLLSNTTDMPGYNIRDNYYNPEKQDIINGDCSI